MKKILFLLLAASLYSCSLFPGSIGKVSTPPKHKITVNGTFIRGLGDNYYLFSKLLCDTRPEVPRDTLTVDGVVYHQVFFAKIISKNLDKDFNTLNFTPCSPSIEIYSKADTVRKQVPGFGERKFLVVEDVVGVES